MVESPCLGIAVDGFRCRECCISFLVNALILQDSWVRTNLRIEILAHAPLRVEEVEYILHVAAELKGMLCSSHIECKVMLVAYVNTMNPWVVEAVRLSIFTLVLK